MNRTESKYHYFACYNTESNWYEKILMTFKNWMNETMIIIFTKNSARTTSMAVFFGDQQAGRQHTALGLGLRYDDQGQV